MTPLPHSFEASQADADWTDLAERLQGPQGSALLRRMSERLDQLRLQLQAGSERGADGATFDKIQASLQAVEAATVILKHLPVKFDNNFDSPWVQVPTPTTRSTP
jgi:hypothetical protein